jgi:hypothetical protein
MPKYNVEIDNGEGGNTIINADTIGEAMVKAVGWVEGWDWPEEGCTVDVKVWAEDEEGEVGEELEESVEIPSEEAKKDAQLEEDGEVIDTNEGEFSTERIVVVCGTAYYQHLNGGRRGAHSRQGGDGVWRERPVSPTKEISKEDAVKLLLDWGNEPKAVAAMVKGIE